MEEKYMVNDILESARNDIKILQDVILNSNNLEFRQTMQSLRNAEESFQYELYKVANSKGYVNSEIKAKQEEIDKIRKELL